MTIGLAQSGAPTALEEAIDRIAAFAGPALAALARNESFKGAWQPGRPWE